ncbi:hypothetical protein AcV5_006110 [Taiwanofungus camphoratus]|nr:hypothetical protein AcW2_004546 [Antrodia cinnamomea]KAI0934177.1 hypothetical protein AcV5_006110 [Antrodia cinnamomea]
MLSEAFLEVVVEALENLNVSSTCVTAVTAFFFYEIITFGQEVQVIWSRKITGASLLYILTRYVTLSYFLLLVLQFALQLNHACKVLFSSVSSVCALTHAFA